MELGYYRLLTPITEEENYQLKDEEPGGLYYVSSFHGDEVHMIQGEWSGTIALELLLDHFEYAPEGIQERQMEMVELMGNLHSAGVRQDNLLASSQTTRLLTDGTKPAQPVQMSDATGIATTKTSDPVLAAHNLKKIKTAFAFSKKAIAKRSSDLQKMIREQELILREKTAALSKQIERAEEAIWMINAYLGKDEEIVQIKKGKPAPADTKICVRQLVLFMDEESAVADDKAKRGGIDFTNIEEFDAWVKEPAHLHQILPEEKGVIAIKPRRSDKHYDDNRSTKSR